MSTPKYFNARLWGQILNLEQVNFLRELTTKTQGIEEGASADQTPAEIKTAYDSEVAIVSQANAEAGTSTTAYRWTPERVKQAIAALEVTDHGALSGLDDDDHTQYHNDTRGDARYIRKTLVATLASDQSTAADTNFVTLTDLVFTYAANSTYRIWFLGRVSAAAATTGCGFAFDLSSAVTAVNLIFYHQLASTGTLTGGHSIADDTSVVESSGMPGTSNYPVSGQGLLVTTSNTGTAQLRFRAEVAAVTTAKAGFTLVVEKVA